MQSTLTLTFDLDNKIGTLTDITDYLSLDFNPVTYNTKGLGTIYFNGVSILSKTLYGDPLINLTNTTTRQFNLELDVNGEVANGVYTVEYELVSIFSSPDTSVSASPDYVDVELLSPTPWDSSVYSNSSNIQLRVDPEPPHPLTILSYGQINSVTNTVSNVLRFATDESLIAQAADLRTVYVYIKNDSTLSFVYTGCDKITQEIGFTYDCDTDPTGSWSVYSNTPTPSGVTVGAATGTIEWPSWTGEPNITVSSLPYSNTALATGTYGATISQVVTQVIQSSPLLEAEYTLTDTYEWKVTCAGSLCELNACIESLRAAHETELLRNKISKYQPYVDNVAIYLHEAQNYKSCGEFDKYRETLAKVKSNLDASGCDCGCCDDNEYKWVAVSTAASTFINNIMSEIQFRVGPTPPATTTVEDGNGLVTGAIWHDTTDDILYKATVVGSNITWSVYYDPSLSYINIATNGLTESPAGTVKLGGALTADTTVGVLNYILNFDASTGVTKTSKNAATVASVAYPLTILGQSPGSPQNGIGSGLTFESGDQSSQKESGRITSDWVDYANENSRMYFSIKNTGAWSSPLQIASNGQFNTFYGSGSYPGSVATCTIIAADQIGNFVEISPSAIATANNGLTKTGNNIQLGGSLTVPTTITVSNTNTLTLSGISLVTGTPDKLLAVTSTGKIVPTSATNADKVYVAQVSQTGTSNPTAVEVVNTLGVTPTFLYGGSAGLSTMTITGTNFNKACVTFTPGYVSAKPYGVVVTYAISSTDTIRIYTHNPASGLENDLLKDAIIKVEFYS